MIKIEHVVLPSPEQMDFVIEGMRNPKNSWDLTDSDKTIHPYDMELDGIGEKDLNLMARLSKGGSVHRKYMRMMPVFVRVTAPLYWWKELDTYKVGTVSNSCSTMHKIQSEEFNLDMFSLDHLDDLNKEVGIIAKNKIQDILNHLNKCRQMFLDIDTRIKTDKTLNSEELKQLVETQKAYWWQMIQLLPSSYNQTRNLMLNYEALASMYYWRKNHKLNEWKEFCKWIESLPYSELITQDFDGKE